MKIGRVLKIAGVGVGAALVYRAAIAKGAGVPWDVALRNPFSSMDELRAQQIPTGLPSDYSQSSSALATAPPPPPSWGQKILAASSSAPSAITSIGRRIGAAVTSPIAVAPPPPKLRTLPAPMAAQFTPAPHANVISRNLFALR